MNQKIEEKCLFNIYINMGIYIYIFKFCSYVCMQHIFIYLFNYYDKNSIYLFMQQLFIYLFIYMYIYVFNQLYLLIYISYEMCFSVLETTYF